MKNIEKHIDFIADLFGHFAYCSKCPCHEECTDDNEVVFDCGEFFKRWAMKEDEEDGQANKTK